MEDGILAASTGGGTSAPDATTSVKGIVQLTGDLGGTATAPTTPNAVKLTGDQSINGNKTFTSPLSIPDPVGSGHAASKNYVDTVATAPDATSSVKGRIQLAGDLGGTAAAPTVPAMVKTSTDQTIAGIKTFSSSPIVPTATTSTQAANKGQLDTAIAAVTIVDATTSVKGKIQLAGDLAGTAAAPTVPLAVRTDAVNQTILGTKTLTNVVVTGTVSLPAASVTIANTSGLTTALLGKGNLYTILGDVARSVGGTTLPAAPGVCVIWQTVGATTQPAAFDINGDIWFNG
jgi:hypothetical protein